MTLFCGGYCLLISSFESVIKKDMGSYYFLGCVSGLVVLPIAKVGLLVKDFLWLVSSSHQF